MEKDMNSSHSTNQKDDTRVKALLEQTEVFSVLSEQELAKLTEKSRLLSHTPGEFIVRQGGLGHSLFIVLDGSCEVFVEDQQGFIKEVAPVEPGGFFGEMSLLTGTPPAATVRALEETVLIAISKENFAAILEANPKLSEKLGEVLATRQKELTRLTGGKENGEENSANMIARIKSFFRIS